MRRRVVKPHENLVPLAECGGREYRADGLRVRYWTARPHRGAWRMCCWRTLLPEVFRDERFIAQDTVRWS